MELILESGTQWIYHLDPQSEIFQSRISGSFDDYVFQIMKKQSFLENFNITFLKENLRMMRSVFISMPSILGWGSFCMNNCISAACHGGNQPVEMLRCNGSPDCFDSGLQVVWIASSSSWQYQIISSSVVDSVPLHVSFSLWTEVSDLFCRSGNVHFQIKWKL